MRAGRCGLRALDYGNDNKSDDTDNNRASPTAAGSGGVALSGDGRAGLGAGRQSRQFAGRGR